MKKRANIDKWTSRSTIVGIFAMLLVGCLFWLEKNPSGAAPFIVSIYSLMIGANKIESYIKGKNIYNNLKKEVEKNER